ncbi:MAG: glycosyltransferase family 4 protein [Elusimicrobiota bacterium]|jgi:glycosyltransferase involved in cell wall biosynthesis
MKILYWVSHEAYFWSHRAALARAAKAQGHEVLVMTWTQDEGARLAAEGFKPLPLRLRKGSINPFLDLVALIGALRIYLREKPDIVHHVALKPVIYGSLAARLAKVPGIVNALAGLGHLFTAKDMRTTLLRGLVKAMLRLTLPGKNGRIIFQNPDDLARLAKEGLADKEHAVLIRGSGVDTQAFQPSPEPAGAPVFLLASRMLRSKGVPEFVEAARRLRAKGVAARFVLVGEGDPENPVSIPQAELDEWNKEGVVEYWGRREDMPAVMSSSHVICLPTTYGEGVPKVLLEAAACGRPIVATDIAGCREIVLHEENGLLVAPRDAGALEEALHRLATNADLRVRMGLRGREIALREFRQELVARRTLELYASLSNC